MPMKNRNLALHGTTQDVLCLLTSWSSVSQPVVMMGDRPRELSLLRVDLLCSWLWVRFLAENAIHVREVNISYIHRLP